MNNPPPPLENLYGDPENRIRIIEDFFYSHFILYPGDRFYFHDAANIMLLLFQQPLAVVGFERKAEGLRRIWRSVFDREFLRDFDRCYSADRRGGEDGPKDHLVTIPDTRFIIGLYHWDAAAAPPGTSTFRPVQGGPGTPPDLLGRLVRRMAGDPDAGKVLGSAGELFRKPYDQWEQWRKQKKSRQEQLPKAVPSVCPNPSQESVLLTENEITPYIERIRKDLLGREIYEEIKDSPLLTHRRFATPDGSPASAGSTTPFPNIWFILRTGSDTPRTRKGRFRYSLRYLFPQEQLLAIISHLQRQQQAATGASRDWRATATVPEASAPAFPGWDRRGKTGASAACCAHYAGQGRCAVPNMGCCVHGDLFAAAAGWTDAEWQRQVSALLESPLGSDARLVADSAFCSSVVEFPDEREALGQGRRRRRVDGNNSQDRNRLRLLSCLKHQIHRHPKGVVYPIMVSGSPWLTITTGLPGQASGAGDDAPARFSPEQEDGAGAGTATMTGERTEPEAHPEADQPAARLRRKEPYHAGTVAAGIPASAWMSTFHFVRSLLRGIVVDRLRRHAERLYLTLLAEEFMSIHQFHYDPDCAYKNSIRMAETMNATFRRLAFVFPYLQVEVSTKAFPPPSEGTELKLLGQPRLQLFLRLVANPYFDRIIPVQARPFLDEQTVHATLKEAVNKEDARVTAVFRDGVPLHGGDRRRH